MSSVDDTGGRAAAPQLTLVIETDRGAYIRTVMPASVLPGDREVGGATEDATRGTAARWGLPDFVFRPSRQLRGSGQREIGDALLLVGQRGAAIQIKARHAPSTDAARERSWLDRKIDQATRQARGTIRSLLASQDMSLTNERGMAVSVRPADVAWRRVIVLDHPGLDDYLPKPGAVVLLRRDWEFLFDQLRSTYAVVEYLHRVSDGDPVPLGLEPVRYYELAEADAATAPSELDERLAMFASNEMSSPLLPRQPVGHGEDRMQVVVRAVLEDIAISSPPAGRNAADMLGVLAAVDAMPVAYRAELSRTMLQWLDEVARVREPAITWRFRIHTWPDRPLLLFAVSSRYEPAIQTAFASWVSLRHQEFLELFPERSDIQTVGVLLTPRMDGSRPWDTTMVATRGDQGLSADERALFEQAWGRLGERRVPETR